MPFSGNSYINVAGATTAAPGQVVQSATWDSIFTDLATALTAVMNQFNAGPVSISGVGTTQAGAAAIGQLQFYVRGAATAGQYAFVMTSIAATGNTYKVFNIGSATAVVWPPVGGQFLSTSIVGATATGVSLGLGRGAIILAVTASTFDVLISD